MYKKRHRIQGILTNITGHDEHIPEGERYFRKIHERGYPQSTP